MTDCFDPSGSHQRRLIVGECSNFRDIGGYLTSDKKHKTRWNRLYRSDHLGKIEHTGANLKLLCNTLKVKASIDFRGAEERRHEPYNLPGVETTVISIEPGNIMQAILTAPEVTEASAVDMMVELNELFVTTFQDQYRQFLRLVIARGKASQEDALVFHCTAGKDRTGYGAALILMLLDVDRDTIFTDFLLTNEYFIPPSETLKSRMPAGSNVEEKALQALFYVRSEYLARAMETIDTRHGGIHNYVKTELGITDEDIQQLRDAYLEPV